MQLKTIEIDGTTYAAVQDGKPVFVDGGKEIPMDVPKMAETITARNGEAMAHRKARETAEAALKGFEGIDDPDAARKAMAIVANLDAKKLVDAGEVEAVRAAAIKAVEEKYSPVLTKLEQTEAALRQEIIGGNFARSKFISEKIAVPADMLESKFGNHFMIEEGRMVAKDKNGNPIYSKSQPGEIAGFDEAIEALIDQYPHRDNLLKGRGANGTGAPGSAGAAGSIGSKQMTRAQYDALAPMERTQKMRDGFKVVDA